VELLPPCEIRELYELHSTRSTAVNQALLDLRAQLGAHQLPPTWDDALRMNRLSMWLHQVLAFDDAINSFCAYAKGVAASKGIRWLSLGKQRRENAEPSRCQRRRGSARGVQDRLMKLSEVLCLDDNRQFHLEVTVAPRHFAWRDAWAHQGGRLRDEYPCVLSYFEQRGAVEELNGATWPLDNAWREARLCFSKVICILARAATGVAQAGGRAGPRVTPKAMGLKRQRT
jgi:hypothetical protein